MATRRPNMPRANRATGQQRGHQSTGREGSASPEPETRDDAQRSGADQRAKVIPLGAVPGTESQPTGARRATNRSSTPPVNRAPQRPASEQRLRERAELSGSIRSPKAPPRSGTRTPAGGNARGNAPAGTVPVPARSFSGRMLALAVVLVAITVLLLPSVGTYMTQRAEMGELRESIAAKQTEQADLNEQIARWDDPVYIKQQARDRINLVMPGERKYMVIGSAGDEPATENESPGAVRTDLPWVDALWDTVKRSATD